MILLRNHISIVTDFAITKMLKCISICLSGNVQYAISSHALRIFHNEALQAKKNRQENAHAAYVIRLAMMIF